MKHLTKISGLLIIFTLLALSACGGAGATATPTVDTAPIFTQIVSTAMALQTQTALAQPAATQVPQASPTPQATNTPLVTDTPLPSTPSATPLVLSTPKATSQASCDNMAFVADATIPDGYVAAQGEVMEKTWRIKNLGPCTWNQDYALIFGWGGAGTNWNTLKPAYVNKLVAPGETVDITMTMTAPTTAGGYGAYFRFRNDKKIYFGPMLTIYIEVK